MKLVAVIILIAGIAATPLQAAPDIVAACVECHGANGMGHGKPMIPVIAGTPAEHLEEAIFAYIDGARLCGREPRMCEVVATLGKDEIFDIADYYATQTRQSSAEDFDAALAVEGEALHRQHCATCHLPPDDKRAATAIGIPLHGQRKEYLRYAIESYFSGDREALLPTMATRILQLGPGDLGALVNYYASYRAAEPESN